MNFESALEWIRSEWQSIVVVSVATLIIAVVAFFQTRSKDLDAVEDNTEEEDLEAVMKYWGPDVSSVSYEVRSVKLTRDTPSSSIEDDAKHRASSQNPTEDQSAKQPVEKDKENVPQTDLKNDKGAEEPMKENGEQKQDSPAKEKDGSKDRPTSDKDILTDRPSDSEKATPLECDQENILKAKIGELYKGENCKWRVLQRKTVKSNFTVQNDWRKNVKSNITVKINWRLVKQGNVFI